MRKLVVLIIRCFVWIRDLIRRIPFGALALFFLSDLCVLAFDKLFLTIGVVCASFKGELKDYLQNNAIINDVKLGVSGRYVLNPILRTKDNPDHLRIGHRLHTISDILGRIKRTKFGNWCTDVFLEAIDKNHCANSVKLGDNALLKRVGELGISEQKSQHLAGF